MEFIDDTGEVRSAIKEEMSDGQKVVVLKDYSSEFGLGLVKSGDVFAITDDVNYYSDTDDFRVGVASIKEGEVKVDWLTLDSVLPVVPLEKANVVVATKQFSSFHKDVEVGEVFEIVSIDTNMFSENKTARILLSEEERYFKIEGATDYSDYFVYAYVEDLDVEDTKKEEEVEEVATVDVLEDEVIYIAAPISTEAEVMYVNKLAETLRTVGYEVYSASEDEEINDKSNNPKAETIYKKDFDAIDEADIVLFIETGKKQVGSHIELGKVLEMRRRGIDVELIAFTNNFRLDTPQTQEGMASESINHLELGGILMEGTFVHGMTDGVIQHLIKRKWGV